MKPNDTHHDQNPGESAPRAAELPEALASRLKQFERRLCLMETVAAVFGGLGGLLLTLALLFFSDRLWDTPVWLRGLLTAAGALGLGAAALFWFRHWAWGRRDARDLARMVQRRHRRMGDRLLGAVELAEGRNLPANASPALCRAAIRQVAEEAARYDFKEAVPLRRPRAILLVFVALAALTAGGFMAFPQAGWNALHRWLHPASDVPRYTFVRLEDLPAEQIVPHGEPFEIVCEIQRASRWKPVRAACRLDDQPRLEAQVRKGRATFRLPGQTRRGKLSIRIGDVVRDMAIVPMFRPELIALTARVELPSYLQRPVQNVTVENSHATFLEGSLVQFTGEADRPLASAAWQRDGGAPEPLAVDGPRFLVPAGSADGTHTNRFDWIDLHALTSAVPYRVETVSVPDRPPELRGEGAGRVVAILHDETLKLTFTASDDYGLHSLWVEWTVAQEDGAAPAEQSRAARLATGAPDRETLEGAFEFSPVRAQVPEDSQVELVGAALDYFPGRKPVTTPPTRIYILSKASHAKLVQEQMQQIQARLEDLAREEERLLTEHRALRTLPSKELAAAQAARAAKAGEQDERANARRLEQLAREAGEIAKEALRNNAISEQTVREWAEMVGTMQKTSSGPMAKAAQALQQAAQASTAEDRGEQLDEGIAREQEALDAMRAMEKSANQSIENLMAQNFINRLKEAADREKAVAETLRTWMPKTIGLTADRLAPEAQTMLTGQTDAQQQNRRKARYIQNDLGGFFQRTKMEAVGAVYEDMIARKMDEQLGTLAQTIARNAGGEAVDEAVRWEKQFRDWAKSLEEAAGQGSGSGSGGSPPEAADMETIIGLMRARMREETVRDQTRALDEEKDANRGYLQASRQLARTQFEMAEDLARLERRPKSPKVREFIAQIGGEMMNTGKALREPRTDASTIAIETEIIERIAAAIQSAAGQSAAAAQAQQMMDGLPGMQPGSKGYTGGGDTDRANDPDGGPANGAGLGERRVEKAGGLDSSALPAEFREALELYFEAKEDLEP